MGPKLFLSTHELLIELVNAFKSYYFFIILENNKCYKINGEGRITGSNFVPRLERERIIAFGIAKSLHNIEWAIHFLSFHSKIFFGNGIEGTKNAKGC